MRDETSNTLLRLFCMDTDFPGTGLRFHQLYAARPEHSGMVVLRPFLHASRMGLAALHPGTCNRRTCLFFWSSPSVRHYFLCRIQLPALHAAPAEWSRPVRYLSVCLTSWLAFSLTPFRDDSTASLDRLGRSTMSFGCHMAFFFLVAPGMGE